MSSTTMSSSNSLAVKLWEKKTWLQAMQRSVVGHAFNRGAIYFPEEFLGRDTVGDQVTFAYCGKLTNIPLGEGSTLDGNEEALDLTSHNMVVNVSRLGVLNPNKNTIEQQRTKVDFQNVAGKQLMKRAVEILDTGFLYQLAGANPNTLTINGTTYSTAAQKLQVQGLNTIVAPTSQRIIRAGAVANDESLTSSNTFSLDLIDYALEQANNSDQPIDPLDDGTFDLYLSSSQVVDLKQDTTGKIQWYNINLAALTGGKKNYLADTFENNMICLGRYNNVNIYEAPRVAYGVNSGSGAVITTVRRAVLVGADAASFASPFGGRITDSDVPIKLFSQMKDYDYYKGQEARLLYGLKKMTPAGKQDIGVVVISTYAAPHY